MTNLSVNMRAFAFVLIAFFAYNVADAFLNFAVDIYFFAEVALYPSLIYGLILFLFHKKFGGIQSIWKTKQKPLLLVRAVSGTMCYVLVILSFKYLTLAEAYTLLLTSPFWVTIFSILLFKEHVGTHRWISMVVGFIGVLTVMIPGMEMSQNKYVYFLPLLGALGFAGFVITTKKIGEEEPLINMLVYPIIVEAIIFIPLILWNIGESGNFNTPEWSHIGLFCAAGLCYLVGTSLSSLGYASGDSSMLAPLHYSQIVWGALIGYFFFQEVPEIWTFIGAGIIIVSGAYLLYRESKAGTITRKHCTTIHD